MNNKNKGMSAGIYIMIMLALMAVIALMWDFPKQDQPIYTDVLRMFEEQEVSAFVINGSELKMKTQDGKEVVYQLASVDRFYEDLGELINAQREAGIIKEYDLVAQTTSWLAALLPYIIIMVVFGFFWFYMLNRQDGGIKTTMNFGKSRAKLATDENRKVTFDDVAGADEEKKDLQEIVEFLRSPQKYMALGARIPKGVMLVGPPGTGKTLIAKAVAGETGVPFFSISGSDFLEMYVGVGAARVRDLFAESKKHAPSIVFIDEIDAIGRRRGAGLGGGHDEREQTLNQLLVEMDGFGNNSGVIIIAATNRVDVLDPALLRAGRFDRQIYIGMPDIKGRLAILRVHSKKKPFEDDVNLEDIARTTVGFSGADLENLLNEAALLTARKDKTKIGSKEIEEAFLKVVMGNEKKSRVVTEDERRLTAYHEAGHAIAMRLLPSQDPVQQISIVPRGRAGGFTLNMPETDKYYASKNEMLDNLVTLLGGRTAEKLVLNDISTGAANDIERASELARNMVTRYGMSDKLGPIAFTSDNDEVFLGRDFATMKNISDGTAALIDQEIKAMIDVAYSRCEALLRDNMDALTRVAEFLLKHETMDGEQFEAVFRNTYVHEEKPSESAETN